MAPKTMTQLFTRWLIVIAAIAAFLFTISVIGNFVVNRGVSGAIHYGLGTLLFHVFVR